MSETIDTNILVYASVPASPYYEVARSFIDDFARGRRLRYVLWPVIAGYLRIITHPRITEQPLPAATAMANVAALLRRPHVVAVGEGDGFLAQLTAVNDEVPLRGNLVTDGHLVALMRQHGIGTIWTHDRDFRKFSGIRVRDPFA